MLSDPPEVIATLRRDYERFIVGYTSALKPQKSAKTRVKQPLLNTPGSDTVSDTARSKALQT
eukprot:741235-Rhodomonas_salina.2